MPTLFYVDDQDLLVPTINEIIRFRYDDWHLEHYAPPRTVADFMSDMDQYQGTQGDRFLFDIFMPVPRRLSLSSFWPEKRQGDEHFCGITLAKWLNHEKNVAACCIAFLTHVDRPTEHRNALSQLFESQQPAYITKSHVTVLDNWLRGTS